MVNSIYNCIVLINSGIRHLVSKTTQTTQHNFNIN